MNGEILYSVVCIIVEVSLVLLLAAIMARKLSPRAGAALLRCAFAVALLTPAAATFASRAPGIAVSLPLASTAMGPAAMNRSFSFPVSPFAKPASGRTRPAIPAGSAAQVDVIRWFASCLGFFWLAGGLFVLLRYLASIAFLTRLFASGKDVPAAADMLVDLRRELSVPAGVAIRSSRGISSPCTFGWMQPKILVPAHHIQCRGTLKVVLAHELCHIRNRDVFWFMIGELAVAVFWFNPLMWWAAGMHRCLVEQVCDGDTIENSVDIETYVSALLQAVGAKVGIPTAASAMMSNKSLVVRLRILVEREHAIPALSRWARLAMACLSAVLLAAFSLTHVMAAGDHAPRPLASPRMFGFEVSRPDSAMSLLKPGEAMLFIEAGPGVTVRSGAAGLMCGDAARCQFAVPAGRPLTLTALANGKVAWHGCAGKNNGRTCLVQMNGSAHVRAAAAG